MKLLMLASLFASTLSFANDPFQLTDGLYRDANPRSYNCPHTVAAVYDEQVFTQVTVTFQPGCKGIIKMKCLDNYCEGDLNTEWKYSLKPLTATSYEFMTVNTGDKSVFEKQ